MVKEYMNMLEVVAILLTPQPNGCWVPGFSVSLSQCWK